MIEPENLAPASDVILFLARLIEGNDSEPDTICFAKPVLPKVLKKPTQLNAAHLKHCGGGIGTHVQSPWKMESHLRKSNVTPARDVMRLSYKVKILQENRNVNCVSERTYQINSPRNG